MKSYYLPLRASMVSAIVIMGVVGVVLMYLATGIYHQKSIENHREDLTVLVKYEIDSLLNELEEDGAKLALNAQNNPKFKASFATKNVHIMKQQLDNEFHQYYVTANRIRLVSLLVFDEDYQFLAESMAIKTAAQDDSMMCSELLLRAKQRTGIDRLRTTSQLCIHQGTPLHGLIVPIGGLKPTGYFMLISDPISKLTNIQQALGFPLALFDPQGSFLFQSKGWLATDNERMLNASVSLKTPLGAKVMSVTIEKNIRPLLMELRETRQSVLMIAIAATIISIILSLLIINRAIFYPLKKLSEAIKTHTQARQNEGTPGVDALTTVDLDIIGAPAIKDLYINLREMAMTDPLTHIHNRYLFEERIRRVLKISGRAKAMAAIILLDMDSFKQVNDTYGHHIGDELLKAVVIRIQGVIRETDEVVRLGGDEFIVLLPLTNSSQAEIVAGKILKSLQKSFDLDGEDLEINCSLGVSIYPKDSEDEEELLKMADRAMYRAKAGGKKIYFHNEQDSEAQQS